MQASQHITRRSASNLALAFILLPKAKRRSMAALYAFCRGVDDVADEEAHTVSQRRQNLAAWRADLRAAFDQGSPRFPVNQDLVPVIAQYHLPFEHFDELIRGMEMDLETNRYADDAALERYCYRAASVVGLLSIEIFGYQNPACRQYAIALGKALQLTNILRDVRGDAERGRIYLPLSTLERFEVRPEEILRLEYSPRFAQAAADVAQRAKHFYRQAHQSLPAVDRHPMIAAELMGAVYWRLLRKLETRRFPVFEAAPTRLSKPHKLFLILRTWLSFVAGARQACYGFP